MAGYQPTYIRGMETGLVQSRQEFILPDDAYPVLENAFVWRERIKRKKGFQLLGRLRRVLTSQSLGVTIAAQTTYTFNTLFSSFIPPVGASEPNKEIQTGTLVITIGAPDAATFTDNGVGGFTVTGVGVALGSSVNYTTGVVTIVLTAAAGGAAITADVNYYPSLPVMGLRLREIAATNNEQTIAFDQIYAYRFLGGWQEFIPGTTWTGNDSDFFWSTNFFVGINNLKIFWVTNFSGPAGDPIRYTNGLVWVDFAPQITDPAGTNERLTQALVMLPFRGRMLAFNTLEGVNLATSVAKTNRIRWAAIGTPFADVSAAVAVVNPNAWRDDIRGQGGFLDIPTSEDIIAVGFVRDNLVIYCERSTWQLRYTGRSIAPFQIEKVNTELGAESTFSAVQFDTSLVGIGDKGIVECDSFKSERIDIKIPDLIYSFQNENNGTKRIHGIRDFQQRLAYWTYPYQPEGTSTVVFPTRRLVYNYENDSWAIFIESLTCLGTFQSQTSRKWSQFPTTGEDPSPNSWQNQNYPWFDRPALFPSIIGGNQQGYVLYLNNQVANSVSQTINDITGNTTIPTVVTSVNHNLVTGQVIQITGIPTGTPFASSLNGGIFYVQRVNADTFQLLTYNPASQLFNTPQLDAPGVYIGGGQYSIKDGFRVVSKKFNFLDDGQNIQLGFIDILLDNTEEGAISLNVYLDYNDTTPVNQLFQNVNPSTNQPDTFFNSVVPTTRSSGLESSKNWKRVFCPVRGGFVTIEWTLSNAQLIGPEQASDVQIDSQILWMRRAGRQLPIGV